MWSRQLILAFAGLMAGGAMAAGTFAFLTIIGVVPRMIAKLKCARNAIHFENMIVLGCLAGSVLSLFETIRIPLGWPLLAAYGISAGMFVGGIAVVLAEILNVFPIIFRRFHVKRGMFWVMTSLALGKCFGSLFFFIAGFRAK